MPEFPDVTVYIEALSERVLNQPIQKIRIGSPFVLRSFSPPITAAEGKRVLALGRLGKRIVFALDGGIFVVIHLMIAGRLHLRPAGTRPPGRVDVRPIGRRSHRSRSRERIDSPGEETERPAFA